MRLGDAIAQLGRSVSYYPSLAPVCGGVQAAVFLCQFAYWTGKGDDPDGWIYKKQCEIEEETGLSRREQETARRYLRERGLLVEERRGVHGTMYYRLEMDQLDRLFHDHQEKQRALNNGGKRHCGSAESASEQRRNPPFTSIRSEITTQITAESTRGSGADAPDTPPSEAHPEAHPEETTVKQRLLRTWRTATGKALTAGQIAKGADLWQMYAVSGRADAFWQLLDEATGKGWRWAGFVSAAEERYTYGPAAYSGRIQTIGRPASMPANDYDPSFDAISRRLVEISPEGFYATQ